MRCCMCQLHIINYSSPVIDTVSFLFTGMRGGLTSFAILSMLISGLKKKKNSQCYYSDLWALWLLGWRWVPLFLTMTHWWDLPLPGHVLFRIYSQGALLGRRLRNTGRNRWKIWATGRCCVCVCVCVCVSCSVGSDSLQPHGLQGILQARI